MFVFTAQNHSSKNLPGISALAALILLCPFVRAAESGAPDTSAPGSQAPVRQEVSYSREWSIVTAPEALSPEKKIPLRPEEEQGGQAGVPATETAVPPLLLPEMTPLHRPGLEEDFLDVLHGGLSRGFLTTATWLDSFFGDERYDTEINRSRFRFRYIVFREEGSPLAYRPDADFRLALPRMQKKTYLMITGDPREDIETSSSPAAPQASPAPVPEDRNVTTSLQYFFRSTNRRSFSVKAGAKFHNGAAVFLLGPRARYLFPIYSWDLRFTEEFLWFSDVGWFSRSRLDFERTLPHDLFFRTSLEGVWTEEKAGYPYSLSFVLLQPLDRNHVISYEWVNSFQTRPTNELDEVLFVVRYRQRIWRDWLYFEIAPQERFPRDRGFHETTGIMFKLEMIIGDYKPFIY